MKEIVDILIKRWQERAKNTDKDTQALCEITVLCLRLFRKYLTGGKKENSNDTG